MRKLFATITWLLFATASHGEAGQHTGVGGNPALPPPQPTTIVIPGLVLPTFIIQPGMIIVLADPDLPTAQDPVKDDSHATDEGDK